MRFRSESDPAPTRIEAASDATTAGAALRAMRAGTHLVYAGDERGARQLLAAVARRSGQRRGDPVEVPIAERYHRQRAAKLDEHRLLARLLVELGPGWRLELRRATEVAEACTAAWGPADGEARLVPLRELLGVLGAYQWQERGVWIEALGAKIHPRYGVFAPTRPAYVDLLAEAPAQKVERVFDVGTGTGVLALVEARRGAAEVVATDIDPRALACARDNVERLGLGHVVRVVEADLFPAEPQRAHRILFNPPWLPGAPRKPIERAIFDPKGAVLERFLAGVREHLEPGGEAWLLLSDLAERLELRPRGFVEQRAAAHGLRVAWSRSKPTNPDAEPPADRLEAARAGEQVVLSSLVSA